ncbi:conserved hypothetical protein [Mucispirillum schaedleri ASF457]|jgi:phosphoglycerol transferase MdoB-like AlkP superfamily enzyme|uniref:Uncharacterized protein n=1 Tax=Mucispirillum schaedleri ASF457 TaxID=1379858 RepID=V2QFW4_9BACT|nr:hypothetical protein N508_000691 [Mucispirillum schaedleri ASF457]SIW08135.1 conserved hypothetical protein [Mucispirillum schaedleri ASF457]
MNKIKNFFRSMLFQIYYILFIFIITSDVLYIGILLFFYTDVKGFIVGLLDPYIAVYFVSIIHICYSFIILY